MSNWKKLLCFLFVVIFRIFLGLTFVLILCCIWPIFLHRYLLSVLAPSVRPDLGLMLTPQSRFFLPESNTTLNMMIKIRLSGKLNFHRLVNQLAERCILIQDKATGKFKYPEFQQYVTTWLGYPFWKNEEKFKIRQHVRYLVLENENELEKEFQRSMETSFSLYQSPWEATFIEIKENQGHHYFWFRWHHVLGDGISLSKALMGATDYEVHEFQHRGEVPLSCWTQVLRSVNCILTCFSTLHKAVRSVPPAPWDSSDLTPVRFATSIDAIPLNIIKGLSRKFEVSAFAIFISIITGAIRRKFLNEGACNLPNNLRGLTITPSPHLSNNLINKFVYFEFIYPIDKSDPLERVSAVEKQVQWDRQMRTSMVLHYLTLILGSLPQCIFVSPITSAGFCNPISIFKGPTVPVSFGGNFVEDITFVPNMNVYSTYSLVVLVLSYNGQCRFDINANEKICISQSAIEELSGYILEELNEMESLLPLNPTVESV